MKNNSGTLDVFQNFLDMTQKNILNNNEIVAMRIVIEKHLFKFKKKHFLNILTQKNICKNNT